MNSQLGARQWARLPDPARVEACRSAPDRGPRILFFTGGSALLDVSRELKSLTHNSVHLMPPFDSGGSSVELRDAFQMLSVGDLRNRLMALADEGALGSPEIFEIFSHRLPIEAGADELREMLEDLIRGSDPRLEAIPQPVRQIVQSQLGCFSESMPEGFDLGNASVGNLVLAGGYLANDRDIDAAIRQFSKLVKARGDVRPVVDCDLHLAARLADGTEVLGQRALTGKEVAPLQSRVADFYLVERLDVPRAARVAASQGICEEIRRAEVLCFPMGSFFSSLLACLLPEGVGAAIGRAECPKLYIPSLGEDPEQFGLSVGAATEWLVEMVRRDAGADTPVDRILHAVLVDPAPGAYALPPELDRVRALGVEVIEAPLVSADSSPWIDPTFLSELLVSLA